MKYLRKLVGLLIAVVFIASLIIGIGVIFAVKNVNVTLKSYTYPDWDDISSPAVEQEALSDVESVKKIVLDKYRGTLIGFVNDGELASLFDGTDYVFESCEKHAPCTLNVTVKERREVFRVATGSGFYDTYDSLGTLMRTGVNANEAVNNLDRAPNIDVFDIGDEGIISSEEITKIAALASAFGEKFSPLRSMVKAVEYYPQTEYVKTNVNFVLRCGVSVRIAETDSIYENKIEKAYQGFLLLDGESKTHGTISVMAVEGKVSVFYYSDGDENGRIIQLV